MKKGGETSVGDLSDGQFIPFSFRKRLKDIEQALVDVHS